MVALTTDSIVPVLTGTFLPLPSFFTYQILLLGRPVRKNAWWTPATLSEQPFIWMTDSKWSWSRIGEHQNCCLTQDFTLKIELVLLMTVHRKLWKMLLSLFYFKTHFFKSPFFAAYTKFGAIRWATWARIGFLQIRRAEEKRIGTKSNFRIFF